jgi:hypothetical protein
VYRRGRPSTEAIASAFATASGVSIIAVNRFVH